MQKFIRLSKYLSYKLSLKTYIQIDNIILDDDFDLNLCIVPTVYYIVIISDSQKEVKSKFLVRKVRDSFQSELS